MVASCVPKVLDMAAWMFVLENCDFDALKLGAVQRMSFASGQTAGIERNIKVILHDIQPAIVLAAGFEVSYQIEHAIYIETYALGVV